MAATQHIRMKWLKRNRWLKSWFKWINPSRCLRMMWEKKRENIQWAVVLWANMTCWVQRWITRLLWADRKATLTHTVATKIWRASLNTQHINLKQQKTTLGATSVSHEQETEAIIHTTSLQLDNMIGKTWFGLMTFNFCNDMQCSPYLIKLYVRTWICGSLRQEIR